MRGGRSQTVVLAACPPVAGKPAGSALPGVNGDAGRKMKATDGRPVAELGPEARALTCTQPHTPPHRSIHPPGLVDPPATAPGCGPFSVFWEYLFCVPVTDCSSPNRSCTCPFCTTAPVLSVRGRASHLQVGLSSVLQVKLAQSLPCF